MLSRRREEFSKMTRSPCVLALEAVFCLFFLTRVCHVTSETLSRAGRSSNCPVIMNGCSIPGDLPFVYKELFTPACNKHDVCYYCGQLYGWSRSVCDKAFKADMYALCKAHVSNRKRFLYNAWNWLKNFIKSKLARCQSVGDVYFKSVDLFGKGYYESKSPSWCQMSCSKPLGQPGAPLSG